MVESGRSGLYPPSKAAELTEALRLEAGSSGLAWLPGHRVGAASVYISRWTNSDYTLLHHIDSSHIHTHIYTTMATIFTPAPPPPTRLGRYRALSPLASVHVSPICLGGMSIGDQWAKFGGGAMDKTSSFALLDAYYAAGGNFIDTANSYQDGTSEAFIGEWMEKRGIRDQMVVATKVRPRLQVCRQCEQLTACSTRRTQCAARTGRPSRRRCSMSGTASSR